MLLELTELQTELREVALKRREVAASQPLESLACQADLDRHDALLRNLWQAVEAAFIRLQPFSRGDREVAGWTKFVPHQLAAARVRLATALFTPLALATIAWCSYVYITAHDNRDRIAAGTGAPEAPDDFFHGSSLEGNASLGGGLRDSLAGNGTQLAVITIGLVIERETLFIVVFPVACLLLVVCAVLLVWRNVHGAGLLYLSIAPSVPLILIQTAIRTVSYAYVYGFNGSSAYGATVALFWGGYLFVNLLLYLSVDALISPAPVMRLLLAVCLISLLGLEITARSGGIVIEMEQGPPTSSAFVNRLLGSSAQEFIRSLDTTVLFMLLTSVVKTLSRPMKCAFITGDAIGL